MKKITFLLTLLIATIGYAQTNLEDFEGSPVLTGFEGLGGANVVANPSVDGNNGSATVGELIVVQAGQPWQGADLVMQSNYLDVSDPVTKPVTVKVYSTTSFTMFAKLGGGQAGAVDSAADAPHGGSGWETLTFTFNENLDGTASANGEYEKVSFFPNWNGSGWHDPEIEITVYIDDITGTAGATLDTCSNGVQDGDETGVDCGGSCPTACPTVPTTPAPTPPSFDPSNVFSVYSDSYSTDPTFDNFDAGWCGGAATTGIMISGNNTLQKNAGIDCHGIDFAGDKQDLSAYNRIHFDFYITDTDLTGDVFNVKLVDFGGGASEASALEININTGTTPALVANQWVSVDIDISTLGGVVAGSLTRSDVAQIGITTANVTNVWYDNIYLYVDGTASTEDRDLFESKAYPNPSSTEWTISVPNNTIKTIEVFNVLGKKVISRNNINSDVADISVETLASGIYLAKINTDLGTKTIKLIRE